MEDRNEVNSIASTKKWLEDVVVKLNFCPFAGREVARGSIRFVENHQQHPEIESTLSQEFLFLDQNPSTETTLVVFKVALSNFIEYLNYVELAEAFLVDEGYEGIYQVASFHPDYQFAGTDVDDPGNYTNRSPFPTIHILREESLDKAIDAHGSTEEIPEANIGLTHKLGAKHMLELLTQCYVQRT